MDGVQPAQGDRVSEAQEIQTADVQRKLGLKPVRPAGRRETGGAGRAEARHLRAESQAQRIAVGFLEVVENVFMIGVAVGILDGRIDAREDSQIVEALLDLGLLDGRKRIARRSA